MATDGPRSYTDAQRKAALALHAEHGPAEAARQLGIPNGTVKGWARKAGVRGPGAASVREAVEVAALSWSRRRAELTDDFGTAAAEFLAKARDSGNPIAVERLTRACCALVEKAELLSGGATSRLDVSDEVRRARVARRVDPASSEQASGAGMTHPLALTDREITRLDSRQLAEYEELLADQAAKVGRTAWRRRARPEQLPPEGSWATLFLRGGRGSGKSWAGAHILAELITSAPAGGGPGQFAVVAPTYGDARDTCIESPESGLLAALGTSVAEVSSGRSRLVTLWNRSLGELRLANGAILFVDGADDGALRIQGKNLVSGWADEIGLWRRWEQAWDESIAYALRKGDARLVATGTPKSDMPARQLVRRLINDEAVVVRRLRTFDNVEHLSPAFIAAAERRAGTRLGRQELEGELLEDVEGALWQRSWIDDNRVSHACPAGWRALVVGLDPSDGSGGGAQQGLVAAGLGMDHRLYVVHSEGMRVSPLAYCERAVRLASDLGASRLVVEKNFGGGYLLEVLEQAMRRLGRRVAVQVVTATQGKHTRAEPVASLYEQSEVHHVGEHLELEEQLVNWTGAPGERSPDLLDSLVHSMTCLMSYGRSGATDSGRAVPYTDDPRAQVEGGAVPWEGSEYGSSLEQESEVLYLSR